jgi:MFS family permease
VVYAVEHIGLSSTEWGLILLIETALKTLMFIPAGMLVDRWGRTASLLAALLLSLVSIPLFAFATSFTAVLLIRAAIAVAFATAIPACTALMADMVPRGIRGRVMAAIGHGGIMIGAAAGGTGGPAVGFVTTIPLMIASFAGGYLYVQNPAYPWFFVLIATAISIIVTVLFIRDPKRAEI